MVIPYDYATIGSQENFMDQVFTSHSRQDTETVDNIVGKLSQAGKLAFTPIGTLDSGLVVPSLPTDYSTWLRSMAM